MADVNKPETRQGVGTRASLPAQENDGAVGTRAPLPARANDSDNPEETRIQRFSRGYLPHYDSPDLVQFITFRLAGSLPKDTVERLKLKLEARQITEKEYFRAVEKALDVGDGPTFLKDHRVARIVAETLTKFDRQKYELIAWVIMANHVHLLLRIFAPYTLAQTMHSIKSFTASAANKILGRSGAFWSPDYFDRFIRDRRHFVNAKRYIEENPVKAGLCSTPEEWPWGSAGWHE